MRDFACVRWHGRGWVLHKQSHRQKGVALCRAFPFWEPVAQAPVFIPAKASMHNSLCSRKSKLTPTSDLASIMQFSLLILLFLQVCVVLSNTEKVLFLGPSQLQVPLEHPTLEDLQLEALSPQHWSLKTHIRAEFPTDSSKYGQASWFLLNRLEEGRRYEVRICWAATVRLTTNC